jgi:hypothetical protein
MDFPPQSRELNLIEIYGIIWNERKWNMISQVKKTYVMYNTRVTPNKVSILIQRLDFI